MEIAIQELDQQADSLERALERDVATEDEKTEMTGMREAIPRLLFDPSEGDDPDQDGIPEVMRRLDEITLAIYDRAHEWGLVD